MGYTEVKNMLEAWGSFVKKDLGFHVFVDFFSFNDSILHCSLLFQFF